MIEPSVRAGNAEAIVGVLQSLGLDVPKLVADAGLSLDAWSNPEELVSLYAIDRLLVRAAAESGCDHVGLLIGVETADLGLPSYLLFNAPNLRTGLRDAIDLFSLMNEGGSLALEENAGEAALRYANIVPMLSGAPHIIDCVLAQIQSVIARYCGAKFAALEVRFPRRPPKDLKPYSNHFRSARLVFNADDAAFLFPNSFLDHCNEKADPALYRFLGAPHFRSRASRGSFLVKIKRALRFMILDGEVSTDELAAKVGLDAKALHSKLRREGANIPGLIADARYEAAAQLLLHTDLSIGSIAHSLGYADASSMSRAFTRKTGKSPKAHRARREPGG